MNQIKLKKIGSQIANELSSICLIEANDSLLKNINITGCEVSNDLSYAKVFFTCFEEVDKKQTEKELNDDTAGYLRTKIANRIELRHTPKIVFKYDESIAYGAAVEAAKGSNIKIGAENVHFKESGAYTGEVSADMLKEAGVEYVVIGHSERRTYFAETDQTVNLRTLAALKAGLKPIICVGETLEQRELGYTETLLKFQTKMALTNVPAEAMKDIIIAYEPVWAIGTGVTATDDQADEGNGFVRAAIEEKYGKDVAEATTVQYGGSMNAGNAEGLLSKVNVDGGLIGGASLKAPDFATIVKAASK